MKLKSLRDKFPKQLPPISKEDQDICDDFMKVWHEKLDGDKRYSLIESFNHKYSTNSPHYYAMRQKHIRTLELGAGIGNQISYEDLSHQDYYAVEIRENMILALQQSYPLVKTVKGSVEDRFDFSDDFFHRVNVVHVLEHLPNLPACIDEVARVLDADGIFQVVVPCDPGTFYEICRSVSTRRLFRKRYGKDFDIFIKREHINSPEEITGVILDRFDLVERKFFPFKVPIVNANLCIGMTFKLKK